MNSLNLPTDSLYKFLAIAGIFIAIVPSLFLYNEIVDLRKQLIISRLEMDILKIEVDYLANDADRLMTKLITTLGFNFKEFELKDYSREEFIKELSEKLLPEEMDKLIEGVSDELDEMRDLSKQNKIKLKEIENKQKLLSFLNSEYKVYLNFTRILMIFGFFLASLGFYFWYKKIQVPQDELLEKKVNRR